jgi:hypothetical protein
MAFLFVVAGCVRTPLRADYVYEDDPQLPVADDSSAVVYFLREWAFIGGGVRYFVFEDNRKIGLLKPGTYFVHKTTPGKHTYWGDHFTKAFVTLDLQAGQTYYISGGVDMGGIYLAEITSFVAEKLLPDLKYARLSTEEEAERIREKEKETGRGI